MKLEIKYYGILSDITGQTQEKLEIENPTYSHLLASLYDRYPSLEDTPFKIAVENQIINNDDPITNHNIALLPPFSGG